MNRRRLLKFFGLSPLAAALPMVSPTDAVSVNTPIIPDVNDAVVLGDPGINFSDLYQPAGVLNWAPAEWTLTYDKK
jgi:hypothetical protein